MNEKILYEVFFPTIVFGFLFFLVGELIGRSKHIGRWWTFFMLFAFIPGIIALTLSPSAKRNPVKGNKTYLFFGILILVLTVILFFSKIYNYEITDFFGNVGLFATGLYLINFSNGKIINRNPKFYFQSSEPKQIQIIHNPLPVLKNHGYYFIIENGVQLETALTFEELKNKRISESTFVWRNGLDSWKTAIEVPELVSIIIFTPPPFKEEVTKNKAISTPPPFNF